MASPMTWSGARRRFCFELRVKPDRIDEYVARHRRVWPDMLRALANSGWHNYSLFLRADGLLIGYVEADDLESAQAAMDRTDVNARWQAQMAEFFEYIDGAPPDQGMALLEEVFHLEDQLDELDGWPDPGEVVGSCATPEIGRTNTEEGS